MKEELINNIICSMIETLNSGQLQHLKQQLRIHLSRYDVSEAYTELAEYSSLDYSYELLQKFIKSKIASGRKISTCQIYKSTISSVLQYINKPVTQITEEDISSYLYEYQTVGRAQNTTVRNCRAYLSSFFSWLRRNRYIQQNPIDLVDSIKLCEKVKKPYTDEELVSLKDNAGNLRNLAIVDFLNSSMVRVSELCRLNRNDIVFDSRECIVLGKGNKERTVYFDGQTKRHLEEYLKTRTDEHPALFVHLRNGRNIRLKASGIRKMLKDIGNEANIEKVHPHRFRRTGATRCLINDVPLDHVQALLGHSDIKTTQIYAKCNKAAVKNSFTRVYGF